jgi:hypothetical protein
MGAWTGVRAAAENSQFIARGGNCHILCIFVSHRNGVVGSTAGLFAVMAAFRLGEG